MPDVEIILRNAGGQDLVRLAVPANSLNDYQLGSPPVAVTHVHVRNMTPPPPPVPEVERVIDFLRSHRGKCYAEGVAFDLVADLLEEHGHR